LAVYSDNNIYFSDTYGRVSFVRKVWRIRPPYQGKPEALSIQGKTPAGLLWHKGAFYVCDVGAGTVRKYDKSFKLLQTWNAASPWNIIPHPDGRLLTISYAGGVQALDQKGGVKTLFSGLKNPFDLVLTPSGNLWVSEQGTSGPAPGRITLRDEQGKILKDIKHTWSNPEGLAMDNFGGLWVADTGANKILRIESSGKVVEITRNVTIPVLFTNFPNGDLLLGTVGTTPQLIRFSPTKTSP